MIKLHFTRFFYALPFLIGVLLFSLTALAQAATVNIIKNGNFTSGTTNNWTDWTFSATGSRTIFGVEAANVGPNSIDDFQGSLNITQSGLTGYNSGPGTLGAGQITLNFGWNTCNEVGTGIQVYVANTLYATFTTPNSAVNGATTGVTTYSNGATGTAGSSIPSSTYKAWTYYPWVINLPTSVANSGDLRISFTMPATGCGADTSLKNITLNVYRPTVVISKTSVGDVGSFSFTGTNGFTSQSITTTASNTAVSGSQQTLAAALTATTLTETIPSGYRVSGITCSGLGSGGSFTPNLTAGTVTLDAAATSGPSNITCNYTNIKLPTLRVAKISNGGTSTFNFSGTNGFNTDSIVTATAGSTTNGTLKILTTESTATNLTETIPSDYFLSNIICSGLGSGNATYNLTTGVAQLNTSATAPGNNITCTYTNTKINLALTTVKTSNATGPVVANQVITYTYTVTNNGNRPVSAISLAETFNGTGTRPEPKNETLTNDVAPTGDSTDNIPNNGTWQTLGAGDTVTFTANYTVTQGDIDTLQ